MASASALFQIDPGTGSYGTAGVAQDANASVTVNCRIASTLGVDSYAWRVFGTGGTASPAITLSGSPTGQIASFTLPAGVGQAYGVELKVNGGTGTDFGDTKTSAVYVLDANGRRPFFIGETYEADATYGVVPRLNSAIASIGGAVPDEYPKWTKYTKTYSDLSSVSDSTTQTLFSLPAKGVIHAVIIKHSTSFAGGGLSGYAVAVGDPSDYYRFAGNFDVFQAATDTTAQTTHVGAIPEDFGSAAAIYITATCTGGVLNAATQGSVDIWVLTSVLP